MTSICHTLSEMVAYRNVISGDLAIFDPFSFEIRPTHSFGFLGLPSTQPALKLGILPMTTANYATIHSLPLTG